MEIDILTAVIIIVFLVGGGILTAFKTSLIKIGQIKSKILLNKNRLLFFFYPVFKYFFKKNEWNGILYVISFTKLILYVLYAFSFFFLFTYSYAKEGINSFSDFSLYILLPAILIIFFLLFVDFLFRILAILKELIIFKLFSIIASFLLIIFFPFTGVLLKINNFIVQKITEKKHFKKEIFTKSQILDMIQNTDLKRVFDDLDQKLLISFLSFKNKVVREIMVPRIDLFTLSSDTTINKAAEYFLEEDYSRIPVYKGSVDHIIGTLMYKDILKAFTTSQKENNEILNSHIESIIKPVIYTPENKKISHLLQEFKNKQRHIAIVVNEYGGTEGIVTIEDVLEELVGEIEDEYDIDEERQYWKLPNGSWIVDAKMSIIDIENKLDISLPHSTEYETIGGFIFHRAGSIPSKGWHLHLDNAEIEVLISNERRIEKIRITPVISK